MKLLYLFLSLFLQTVLAAPHLSTRNIPVPPSQDPFYQPPAGFESQPVGSILRHRIRENLFGIVVLPEKVKQVHQFLVRSENSFGVPNAILTTLFIPYNADPSKLLSYQAAEDAAFIDCLPLYAMQLLLNPATILTPQVEQLLAQTGLNAGWYVVIPDFEVCIILIFFLSFFWCFTNNVSGTKLNLYCWEASWLCHFEFY